LLPFDDLLSRYGADFVANDPSFGGRLAKVDFAVLKLVAQLADITGSVAEAFGHDPVGQPLNIACAQCLIAVLPIGREAGKKNGLIFMLSLVLLICINVKC